MKKCVTVNKKGDLIKRFKSIKAIAEYYGLSVYEALVTIHSKEPKAGVYFMFEKDYEENKKNKKEHKTSKRKRYRHTQTAKEKMSETKQRNKDFKRKIISDFAIPFLSPHIEWLRQLKDAWLARGDFGIRPELIADFYPDYHDKEIAMLSSLLITHKERCFKRIQRMHNILGDHPWEWFKNRGWANNFDFTHTEKRQLWLFFEEWWMECFKLGNYNSIWDCVRSVSERNNMTYSEMMYTTSFNRKVYYGKQKCALLLLVLSHTDGLGQGLWDVGREDVQIPIVGTQKAFLRTFIPNCTLYGNEEDCLRLLEMDSVDFYYCYQAYETLKKFRPKECSAYATFYLQEYDARRKHYPETWERFFPKIDFSPESEFCEEETEI